MVFKNANTNFKDVSNKTDRIVGLDILRSIAIWNVVVVHLIIAISAILKVNLLWIPIPDGVDLFFVLSGFLIGSIFIKSLQENKQENTMQIARDFWIMRWFRTLPNYYWITFIVFCMNGFHMPFKNLIFMQNFYKNSANPFPETWSLAVEEWFYILLPFIAFLFLKLFNSLLKSMMFTVVFFLILSCFFRIIFFENTVHHDFSVYLTTIRNIVLTRLDSIAVGLFGACMHQYFPAIFFSSKIKKLFLGFMIVISYTVYTNVFCMYKIISIDWFNWNFSSLIMACGVLMMFPFLLAIKIKNGYFNKIITLTSNISYSMYLIHKTILLNVFLLIYLNFKIIPIEVLVPVYFIVLYLMSYLNYTFIEKYFIKLRYVLVDMLRKNSLNRVNKISA